MRNDQSTIQGLVNNPSETLQVELKSWLDIKSESHIAKIAKACLALRNNNGGFLVIGFDNDTCKPASNPPQNVRDMFHADLVQGIVSKYASEKFEIEVKFVTRDEQEFPVICVAEGVRTPVAAKADLKEKSGKLLIKEHAVYVRSLNSNGTASSTEATHRDLDRLVTICMDNREADVGRFLRRHLLDSDMIRIRDLFQGFGLGATRPITADAGVSHTSDVTQLILSPRQPQTNDARKLLDDGLTRYETLAAERALVLSDHGAFEAAVVLSGPFPSQSASRRFLNLITSSNPRLTGWPFWLDSRAFRDETAQPHVFNGRWESLMIARGQEWFNHLDFWILDPIGMFYHRRLLEDDAAVLDMPESPRQFPSPKPLSVLDIGLQVGRVGEVLATAQAFARAMEFQPTNTTLRFCFRWTRLKGRHLGSWGTQRRFLSRGPSYQDSITTEVELPAETADAALFQYVHAVTWPLAEIFDGLELGPQWVEEIIEGMLKRKL